MNRQELYLYLISDDLSVYSFEGEGVRTVSTSFNFSVKNPANLNEYLELCARVRERQIWQAEWDSGK